MKIGPKTTKNRFYQVPHCTALGTFSPHATAKFREIKAEGGWGVVNTELCMIHPSSDSSPSGGERLWSDDDMPGLQLMVEAVQKHGALAGCELTHQGALAGNRMSRERPMSASPRPAMDVPAVVRQMDKQDIVDVRRWHRAAARRARDIGFDIVYVYASHMMGLPGDFITERVNRRTDEYGGVIENRARLLRELIEDTKEEIGSDCAVAVRFGVDEGLGDAGYTCSGDGRRVVEMLAELPDLWDVNVQNINLDVMTARFADEGWQEPFTAFVKQVTTKPVVAVGRYTSPDRMVSLIKNGLIDLIGAARPSIADPFLPRKIEEGRIEDIRECIGCNTCLSMQYMGGAIRCTQNPTTGEEWRRGWHPERIPAKMSDERILVIGSGPAGLEAALTLGRRGYSVALSERSKFLGGRSVLESALPGLATYRRVADYRIGQIHKLANVDIYLGSEIQASDMADFDFTTIVVATGSTWDRDGIGKANRFPVNGWDQPHVITPDNVMAGRTIEGPVVINDDEGYYLGGVIAEKLARQGLDVTLLTPDPEPSPLLKYTSEREAVHQTLLNLGVKLVTARRLVEIGVDEVEVQCVYTGKAVRMPAATVVMVCLRSPSDGLLHDLRKAAGEGPAMVTVHAIGDCYAPGTIADAVHSGHRVGREMDQAPIGDINYLIEKPFVRERGGWDPLVSSR
ncbi:MULTISPECIES: FAD-dependent oxidoreductase [unclassified Sphingopyxis]|uniref:oxidoreductase n=1 Tax=unclassified Sphingopyxis TaxID=2614943 RepID=UPI0024ACD400|nr:MULTISPECIES: FAD-dependent oxidoreductase [unclassified Sphingopyxis]